ncbi:AMP-binding protein [Pontibacter chinhatensis]|uniref:Fatty-acyl-CoA synthase n=1 Tax=Pontibacter chinhatensis TaxID=1436961 RepID=A0A1I2XFZ1_9BACT|nr:AMP-binding protein [Pontibacter chinhatensis]SFH12444.1 fatty-acyl-CoA synthase [Pontibacter chinhatensis]
MNTPSYSHGASTTPLLGETIGQSLKRTVKKYGDREALVMVEQNYRATYQEFWEQVEQVAKALLAYNIKRGDRVGIWSANRYEWVLVQFATARVGAILVTINPGYKTNDLQYALRQSRVNLLITAPNFRQTNYVEMLEAIRPTCEYPKQTVIFDRDWEAFLEAGKSINTQELEAREQSLTFDDPINIQYTSGTTGFPKGATLSHHNILNNGFFIGEILKYTEQDRVCIPVPFYHCFGMVIGNMACITHGATMVITAASFDPEQVMQVVQDEKCTSLYGVPTMFIAELGHPNFHKYDFSSLRTGVMAGSNCPIDTMKKVQQLMNMQEVTVCYGMTETSPVSIQSRPDAPLYKRVSTVGTVHPHLEVKIVDPETGQVVPRGEQGELCTRGYSVMLGYWDMPEATAKVLQNGWMHTGDLAEMDEEGYVKIVGRIKDLIIRGGENIAPREVEEFLMTQKDVVDVQVIGVPDAKYGEQVMAWVKLKEGATTSPEELTAYCKGKISTVKIPRYWKFVEEFPMTVTGKIRKMEMREISTRELNLAEVMQQV